MQKLGKVKKIKIHNDFRVKYGTVNYQQPKSLYVIIESWIEPKGEYSFEQEVRKISKQIRQTVFKHHDSFFLSDVLIDVDLRASGMRKNNLSFMSIELTLFPQKIIRFPNDEYKIRVAKLVQNIIFDLIDKNVNYNYNNSKKKN